MPTWLTPWLTPFLLWTACFKTTAQPAAPTIPAQQLTRQLDSIQKVHKIPGLQVLVFTKDSLLYQRHAGFRNRKAQTPVTPQTLFPVASITKSFVAVAALLLVQEGKLALADEVQQLAPEIQIDNPWQTTAPVRVAHLLEHTAGFDDWSFKAYAYNNSRVSLQEGLSIDPQARHCRWQPGTIMSYSNAGAPVVARLIERKMGQEFESFVRQRIFLPLGMHRATFHQNGAALTDLATGYVGADQQEAPYWHLLARPSGGLNVSALELMPFVQMLMGRGAFRGQPLLAPALVERLETPTTSLASQAGCQQGYGLGTFVTTYQGHRLHGHDGAGKGFRAHYLYHAGLDRGIIFLINTEGPSFFALRDALLQRVMQPVAPHLPPAYALSRAQKQAWLGYYRPGYFRTAKTGWFLGLTQLAHIEEEGGQLVLYDGLGSEPTPLRPISPQQVLRLEKRGYTPALTLMHDDPNQPVLVRAFGAGLSANALLKTSLLGAWLPVVLGPLCLLLIVLCVLLGMSWLVGGIWRQRRGRRSSAVVVRTSLLVYGLSYLTMVLVLAGGGDELGVISLPSLLVFAGSLLGPVAALSALVSLLGSYRQLVSRGSLIFMSVTVSSSLVVVVYMGIWGLIGFQTWA